MTTFNHKFWEPLSPNLPSTPASNLNSTGRDRLSLWPWAIRLEAIQEPARPSLAPEPQFRQQAFRSDGSDQKTAATAEGHSRVPETVADVMTRDVISVSPATHVHEIADTLVRNRISAVPVIAADRRLLGIVSEGDLMRRVEIGTERDRSWWIEMFRDASAAASDYVKAHGRKASHIMTPRPITATEDMPLSDVARILEKRRIKRLPVVRGDFVVGIVSRSDLVQALANLGDPDPAEQRTDDAIRKDLEVRIKALPSAHRLVNVSVHRGAVDLSGLISSPEERLALHVAAENTPGVRAINDQLLRKPISAS